MLDERKTAILRAVVQEYIATAQPVGSSHIADAPGVRVSSATVRNEMAVLEQEGYLIQPHTSAGRIPTDKGYRFFVDAIGGEAALDHAATTEVSQFFDGAHGRLEELLHRTADLLARVTSHAAVVVGPTTDQGVVRSAQVVGLSGRAAMVVVVMSSGAVETETFELPDPATDLHLNTASATLARTLVGTHLDGSISVAGTGDATVDAVCQLALGALRRTDAVEPVFVGGASAMAQSFDTVDTVRDVLRTLEQQYVVVSLVRDILGRGLSVAIGAEHGVQPLAVCSVVVAPVVVDGEHLGSVGVLGPTRMDYPQALATVDVVSGQLGRRLEEGLA
jgi:heat-inducible transcriptional repressor